MGVEEKIRRIRESSVKEVYVMLFLISLTFSDKLLKLGKRLLTISRWRNKLPNVKSETRNEKNSRIARINKDCICRTWKFQVTFSKLDKR